MRLTNKQRLLIIDHKLDYLIGKVSDIHDDFRKKFMKKEEQNFRREVANLLRKVK